MAAGLAGYFRPLSHQQRFPVPPGGPRVDPRSAGIHNPSYVDQESIHVSGISFQPLKVLTNLLLSFFDTIRCMSPSGGRNLLVVAVKAFLTGASPMYLSETEKSW